MFKRIANRIRNTYNNVRTRVSNLFRKKKPANKDVATAKGGKWIALCLNSHKHKQ